MSNTTTEIIKWWVDQLDENTIIEMRGWISDCGWSNVDPDDIPTLSDYVIVRGVEQHYSGGVEQFLADVI